MAAVDNRIMDIIVQSLLHSLVFYYDCKVYLFAWGNKSLNSGVLGRIFFALFYLSNAHCYEYQAGLLDGTYVISSSMELSGYRPDLRGAGRIRNPQPRLFRSYRRGNGDAGHLLSECGRQVIRSFGLVFGIRLVPIRPS